MPTITTINVYSWDGINAEIQCHLSDNTNRIFMSAQTNTGTRGMYNDLLGLTFDAAVNQDMINAIKELERLTQ